MGLLARWANHRNESLGNCASCGRRMLRRDRPVKGQVRLLGGEKLMHRKCAANRRAFAQYTQKGTP